MTPQEFARKIETAMSITPELVTRGGDTPTGCRVKVRANQVEVRWEREVDAFGKHYEYSARIEVKLTDTGWQFCHSGVCSEWDEYRCWFPGWCRWARTGDSFDPQKLIDYYSLTDETADFDWSLV